MPYEAPEGGPTEEAPRKPILGTYMAVVTLRGEGGVVPLEIGTIESILEEALEKTYGGGVTANVSASRTDI
jgi:hypothetical protein